MAVLVGGRDDSGASGLDWKSHHLPVEPVSHLEAGRASRTIENLGETIVLDGDDRLVARALTAYRRRHVGRDRPLRFVPLRTGSYHRIADEVGGPRPSERLARQLADGGIPGHWSRQTHPTLRLTTSARPAPLWGFSVGAGIVFRLFETVLRSEGEGLSGLGSMASRLARQIGGETGTTLESQGARVSVDYEPQSEQLDYLLATALSTTWLGLPGRTDGAPAWIGGTSGRQFLTRVAGSAALPSFLGGGGTAPFERLHVDGSEGFVVDGELYDPGEPHVLEVAEGRPVTFTLP